MLESMAGASQRHKLLAEELRRHQLEHGEFTESERAAARAAILDAIDGQSNAA
jgi:hypothetical protein